MAKDLYAGDGETVNDAEMEELTDDERIAILRGVKELLGENGEHWGKTAWFGRPYSEGPTHEGPDYVFHTGDEVMPVDPGLATTWCLLGAFEEVGYRLGITSQRVSGTRYGPALSISKLLNDEYAYSSVYKFNDSVMTDWDKIESVIDKRLSQLESPQQPE